jgi:hypothetical protein
LPAKTRYTTDYDINTGVVSLKIDDARPDDIGKYSVSATNIAGSDETEAEALLRPIKNILDDEKIRPPKIIIPLTDKKITEEDEIIFFCKVDGYPTPEVKKICEKKQLDIYYKRNI